MERTQTSTRQFPMLHNLPQREAHWSCVTGTQETYNTLSPSNTRSDSGQIKYQSNDIITLKLQEYISNAHLNKHVVTNYIFHRCTVLFDIYEVHTPTNALFIKLDKVLKFTLKITLTCSYMFRSTTIIREPSL